MISTLYWTLEEGAQCRDTKKSRHFQPFHKKAEIWGQSDKPKCRSFTSAHTQPESKMKWSNWSTLQFICAATVYQSVDKQLQAGAESKEGRDFKESVTQSEGEVKKCCSQNEIPHSWIKIGKRRHTETNGITSPKSLSQWFSLWRQCVSGEWECYFWASAAAGRKVARKWVCLLWRLYLFQGNVTSEASK